MVSAALVDALTDPIAIIQALHKENGQDSLPARVDSRFRSIFESRDAFLQIPVLDVARPPPHHKLGTLVRFRGMVQDTSLSSEMYHALLPDGRSGGWGTHDASEHVNYAHIRECSVLWAVSVPGESSWVADETGPPPHDRASTSYKSEFPQKFTVPDAPHVGVQLKIYETGRADAMKSTEIYEFVGVLASEPWHGGIEDHDIKLVPTLHTVFSRTVPSTLVPRQYPLPMVGATPHQLRTELVTWIAEESLAGDRDAAEWVLLTSISRVQFRSPPILPPSLTLSRFPRPPPGVASTSPTLLYLLSCLLPMVSTIPLTLDTINKAMFSPESRNEDLHSGYLQLPKGSLCVITESGISEGDVSQRGIMNLKATQDMISTQSLQYVFPFSSYSFQTDVPFLLLSEGRKSAFFQTSVNMPLAAESVDVQKLYKSSKDVVLPEPEKLAAFRAFIGGSKVGTVTVSEESAQHIQDDFVRQRKEAASSATQTVTSDDLIHRMLTARLLALSLHESDVTRDVWERVKEMETIRLKRLL